MNKYKRVLLKLSGEALAGSRGYGIDVEVLNQFILEIKSVNDLNTQVAIVVGGGNIFRGLQGIDKGFDRVKGDYMGMLATTINAIAICSAFESIGVKSKVLTSTFMEPYAERYSKQRAIDSLECGEIVIFAGGTGNPFFSTDTASALRAIEIEANAVLKGTNVDGVYNDDPNKNPEAIKFENITFKECVDKQLKVMDLTAFTLCMENKMPIVVFKMAETGNLKKIIEGEKVGTLVS
jgi:uridylate kinase